MRRALIIALAGLILISLLEWGINNEIGRYQTDKQSNQYQRAAFGGPVFLGLRDGLAYGWYWVGRNDKELLVIFTALLAVVTIFLTKFTRGLMIYTRELWGSTSRLVIGSEDTAEKELRAYVFIKSASIGNIVSGGKPKSALTIRNFGKTPAHKATLLCGMGFGESFGTLPKAEGIPVPIAMGTLAPGGKVIHNFSPHTMTADHIAALEAGTHSIFVYGEISYIDFAGRNRYTKFRAMKNTTVGLDNPHLAFCEEGNETEEDK